MTDLAAIDDGDGQTLHARFRHGPLDPGIDLRRRRRAGSGSQDGIAPEGDADQKQQSDSTRHDTLRDLASKGWTISRTMSLLRQ